MVHGKRHQQRGGLSAFPSRASFRKSQGGTKRTQEVCVPVLPSFSFLLCLFLSSSFSFYQKKNCHCRASGTAVPARAAAARGASGPSLKVMIATAALRHATDRWRVTTLRQPWGRPFPRQRAAEAEGGLAGDCRDCVRGTLASRVRINNGLNGPPGPRGP